MEGSQRIIRWSRLVLLLVAIAAASWIPIKAQSRSSGRFDGKWEWKGDIGWQRLALDLKEDRGKLLGTVKMGPGPGESTKPEDYWEYFFNPVTFEISNGTIHGDTLSFEQKIVPLVSDFTEASNIGPVIDELKFQYTGTLEGGQLVLKRELHQPSGVGLNYRNQRFEIVMVRPGTIPNRTIPVQPDSRAISPGTLGTIDVAVKAGDGTFITSLRKDDFQVLVGGVSQGIQSVEGADTPLNSVFLFDMDALLLTPFSQSGDPAYSARGAEHGAETWRQLGDSIALFYRSLRSQDRFAIDLFVGDRTLPMLPWQNGGQHGTWTTSRSILQSTPGARSDEEKDLYRAIRSVLERLRSIKGQSMVVLVTDGRDGRTNVVHFRTKSGLFVIDPFYGLPNADAEREFEQLLDAVQKSGVRFFVASVNGDRQFIRLVDTATSGLTMLFVPEAAQNFPPLHQAADERLGRLARISGGAVIARGDFPRGATAIADLAERLALGRTYRITYASAAKTFTALKLEVEVRVRDPQFRVEPVHPEFLWNLQ